ncbi:MAG TPA: hypothetical protein VMR18_00970 [Candidatus Saccharimonadales bacterium]|nr:hypothetical protein [Candidatus Saccharimonadales bacterium]
MTPELWSQLKPRQQTVMLIAIYVRNAMEDFHVKNLSDAHMKELNKIIRQSLYEIMTKIEDEKTNSRDLMYLVWLTPSYWEIPDDDHSIIDDSRAASASRSGSPRRDKRS